MDTGKPIPKIAANKVQETLHFRYLKLLVMDSMYTQMLRMYGLIIPKDPEPSRSKRIFSGSNPIRKE